uniref:PawS1a n=1 Tax=Zinnia haageana TaxID=1525732 RepID=A0A0A0V2B6_9ASTR|nr:PawS1a precursor [Zinnia haageana]
MAVKVALVVLAVSAILAFVEVSGYRTSITTVTIQDNGICFKDPFGSTLCAPYGLGENPIEDNGICFKDPFGSTLCAPDGLGDNPIADNGICFKDPFGSTLCAPDGLGDNPREQCDRQIPIQQLNHCQMHLTRSFGYKLRTMAVENPIQQQHLSLCCNQLQQVEEQCQCKAVRQVAKQALKQLQQQPGGQQRIMKQMLKKAQNLPNECSLKCSI